MTTITARHVDCDDRGRMIYQPVHYAVGLRGDQRLDLLLVAGRYLRERYGVVGSVGSSSSADYVANDVLEVWLSVSRPEAPLFHSIRFSFRKRVDPKYTVGQSVRVRWSSADVHGVNLLGRTGTILDVTTEWPNVWVRLDGDPEPRVLKHCHVEGVER